MISKLPGLLAAMAMLLTSCTVTRPLAPVDEPLPVAEMNNLLQGRLAFVEFLDGRSARGRDIAIRADSVTWTEKLDGHHRTRPLPDVKQIYYERPGRGIIVGAAVAVAFGIVVALTPKGDGSSVGAYATPPKELAIFGVGATCVGVGALAEAKRRYVVYQQD